MRPQARRDMISGRSLVSRPGRVGRASRPHALTLVYHQFPGVEVDPWELPVRPDRFAKHLDVGQSLGRPSPLRNLVPAIARGRVLRVTVAVTFRSAMRVLHAQRDHVRGNAKREAAYAAGVRNWQRIYGDPVLAETLAELRNPRMWRLAAAGLGTLLRHYPRGVRDRFRAKVARAGEPQGPRAYLP